MGNAQIKLPGKIVKLIIGIGNPGYFFTQTRHNAGLIYMDYLIDRLGMKFSKVSGGEIAFLKKNELEYIGIFKSNSYMNLSGYSVKSVLDFCQISDLNNIIVIHDELDTSLGKCKVKLGGSAEGHNGIKSIIYYLNGENKFKRLKIGIGRPNSHNSYDVAKYVCSNFTEDEHEILKTKTFLISDQLLLEKEFLIENY